MCTSGKRSDKKKATTSEGEKQFYHFNRLKLCSDSVAKVQRRAKSRVWIKRPIRSVPFLAGTEKLFCLERHAHRLACNFNADWRSVIVQHRTSLVRRSRRCSAARWFQFSSQSSGCLLWCSCRWDDYTKWFTITALFHYRGAFFFPCVSCAHLGVAQRRSTCVSASNPRHIEGKQSIYNRF